MEAVLREDEVELSILVKQRADLRAEAKKEAAQAAAAKARRLSRARKGKTEDEEEEGPGQVVLDVDLLAKADGSDSKVAASKGSGDGGNPAAVGGIKEGAKGELYYERVEKKTGEGGQDIVSRRDGVRKLGARQVRALEVLQKSRQMQRQNQMMPMASLRTRNFPEIASKVAREADVAAAEIENDTFLRVARLLHFVLDKVWIDVVTPSYSKSSNLKV